jgi:streptogramin lyase
MSILSLPGTNVARVISLTRANRKDCKRRGTSLACTVDLKEYGGYDTFTVNLYATTNGTGTALSTASAIARIKPNQTRVVSLTLEGVPATILTNVANMSAIDDGAVHTSTFSVSVQDASGATIVGPTKFATPLQVTTNGDAQEALNFLPASIISPSSVDSTVRVTYNSITPLSSAQIVISAPGATSASINFSPMVVTPNTLSAFLTGGYGQTETMNVSEAGYSGAFSIGGANGAVSATCVPANCTPASGGSSVKITFTPVTPGSGTFTISDALGTTLTLPFRTSAWSRYTGIAGGGKVANLLSGPDGNLWGVVQSGGSGTIVQSTTSGTATAFPLPSPFNPGSSPDGVAGTDGAIWLVDGSSTNVYRVSTAPATVGQVSQYATADGAAPTSIVLGPDQETLWFTDARGNIGSINEQTLAVNYKVNAYAQSMPSTSIAIDASSNLYFINNQTTYKMTASGAVSALLFPVLPSGDVVPPNLVIIGPDKNLWLGTNDGYLCDETTTGKTIGCYPNLLTTIMYSLAVGPDGAVYASGVNANMYATITRTAVGGATETYIPVDCCPMPNNVVVGPDQALWIAYTAGLDRIVP